MHLQSARSYRPIIGVKALTPTEMNGATVMDGTSERWRATDLDHRACLVAGCPCKDARIVSQRRVAFFAAWAKERGETADRTIDPDPTWSLAAPASRPTARSRDRDP